MDKINVKQVVSKIFSKIFLALLIGFTAIYISEETGYYEFEQHNKKVLTEKQIAQFENDVANGKNIDINKYVLKDEKNYSNKLSNFGLKVSDGMSDIVVGSIESTFKFLNNMLG